MSLASTPTRAAAYVGRFAPSPTGKLHMGSLVSATISWLDARACEGIWRVRIEDVDRPREIPGAARSILDSLECHGLFWDGPVLFQNQRDQAYDKALQLLKQRGWAYDCACSRTGIEASARRGIDGAIYPGTCRNGLPPGRTARAVRVRTDGIRISFRDRLAGEQDFALEAELGDFVIRRADGLTAYQLAVVVDDAWQGITHVVRGMDLLSSTPRQIHLQNLLGLPTPVYMHHPLALDATGNKLSKQTGALALDAGHAVDNLRRALNFLGLVIPAEADFETPEVLLEHALELWRRSPVAAC